MTMGDVVRFVDSIAASPTVRLDLNDEVSWWVRSFKAPPPRLRRSQSSNAMRDGIHVGSSTYESRTVTLELECIKSTQDSGATEIQKLWRELDRADNYLMYQPTGATKPVFFRLYRSDAPALDDVIAQAAHRTITVELLAEPFAIGLKETLGPYTVNNDPAHASNPCYFDVSGVLGDVAADVVMALDPSTSFQRLHLAKGADRYLLQLETLGPSTDTTNPGGGPDAAMSGTGTNNFLRTTFATTPGMTTRAAIAANIPVGTYRVLVGLRRSDATSVIRVKVVENNTTVTLPLTASRHLTDIGVYSTVVQGRSVGYSTALNSATTSTLTLQAARDSGAGSLDWDFLLLVPADETTLVAQLSAASTAGLVLDGVEGKAQALSAAGDPTLGAATFSLTTTEVSGDFPAFEPNATTRVHLVQATGSTFQHDKSVTAAVTIYYWPRYLFVRPSAS